MIADKRISQYDLNEILHWSSDDIRHFDGKRIFLPRGFVGTWLAESILYANESLGTDIKVFFEDIDSCDATVWGSHSDPPETDKPLLYLSSGAVYFDHHRPEIAEEKRRGEAIVRRNLNGKIARMFSFIGPHLGGQYVATQLMLQKYPIIANPYAIRSWMYPTDMVRHLWRLFASNGKAMANIASDDYRTVGELATLVCRQRGTQWAPGWDFSSYRVPQMSTVAYVGLEEAVRRTVAFYAA